VTKVPAMEHQPPCELGKQLLEQDKLSMAIEVSEAALARDFTGQCHAVIAIAHFRRQEYALAAEWFEAALKLDPANIDWLDLLNKSRANAAAQIQIYVPAKSFFDANSLLQSATPIADALPTPPQPRRVIWGESLRRAIGTALGAVVSQTVTVTTSVYGRLTGYSDRIWTNWYRRSLTKGILTLAHMRERLNKNNLKNTYPAGSLTGFQRTGQTPPPGVTHFRTADGSWNNLANPKEGAAGTRFLRNVSTSAIHPGRDLLTPNPREVSRKLLTRPGNQVQEVPFLNMLAAIWIQFENHDWINHGEPLSTDIIEIPLADDDPARRKFRQTSMCVGRTQPDPTWHEDRDPVSVTYINEVTHWWDGSQIYGSDYATQRHLRSFQDGKLRMTPHKTLPIDADGVEETGFRRNWWVGLATMHTLFVCEHNSICDWIKIAYPHWKDDRLFNVARLINAAVMAKIHTVEWTPAILPNPGLNAALNANWFGILTNLLKYGKDRETLSEINVRNPEMGGVVGNPIDRHGVPYGLTEEFTEVYRLHSLLPDTLSIRRVGDDNVDAIPVAATRQAASAKTIDRFGIADLLYSFGTQHPGALVLNNFPTFMQELSIAGNPLFDMGAVDILRARERGVPRYNDFRRQLGLNPIASFDDLTDDLQQIALLKQVYGDDVEKLDLMIGTLAEGHRPTHFGFGETMFQIFILNATRRLQADRFYTDSYNEETYTPEGLEWIDRSTFKAVILRAFPQLAHSGLANVSNAFEPWDSDERLTPERHPLRQYDRDLGPDPWLGDAYR
jgi:Animal haem peroxidase